MTRLADAVVAITGAGGGLGRELALEAARRGADVAASDIDPDAATATAERCRELGARALGSRFDVRDADAGVAWAEEVRDTLGGVDVLVNNAGVAHSALATEQDLADVERVLDIDLRGLIRTTHTFLPHLGQRGRGHVVNVSSVLGLVAGPSLSAYNAAKFGVRGWSEALAIDLRASRTPIGVTTVHPGSIATDFATSTTTDGTIAAGGGVTELFALLGPTAPDRAARQVWRAVARDRTRVVLGLDGHLLYGMDRVLGSATLRPMALLGRVMLARARRTTSATSPRRPASSPTQPTEAPG